MNTEQYCDLYDRLCDIVDGTDLSRLEKIDCLVEAAGGFLCGGDEAISEKLHATRLTLEEAIQREGCRTLQVDD